MCIGEAPGSLNEAQADDEQHLFPGGVGQDSKKGPQVVRVVDIDWSADSDARIPPRAFGHGTKPSVLMRTGHYGFSQLTDAAVRHPVSLAVLFEMTEDAGLKLS
ncbi:hypothetical protein V5799_033733 [Amblyomma americanum]|uniref:Uncharacterized protein n=1 Tax=Amblyomma americanum TaxID=6943 RepID=A0AAQ4DMG7_AMBAM